MSDNRYKTFDDNDQVQMENYAAVTPPPTYSASASITSQPVIQNVIVTQQPSSTMSMPRVWRNGLCNCFGDCGTCLCVTFFQPCFSANLATRFGECCCVGCTLPGLVAMRTKVRTEHNIMGDIGDDVCVTCCCTPCMLCQLSRELDAERYPKGCCAFC